MTPLQKEIEAFEKEKLGYLDWCGNEDHECECSVKEDEIKSFLRQSLPRFARSVIEEAMPKGRGFIEEGDIDMVDDSWNACLDKIRENTERILKDNEKEA